MQDAADDQLVAVVGAGAAGIAAARRFRDAGRPVLLVEARQRLGGRAWTVAAGGFPLDLGCGWLHSADRNPLSRITAEHGFAIDRTPPPWGRPSLPAGFPAEEQAAFFAASAAFYRRLDAAADGPAAACLPADGRWNGLLNAVNSYVNGTELDRLSVHDFSRYDDSGVNWRVAEGYGAAIAALGSGLPAALGCAVTEIDHGGSRIRLATSGGTIEASQVVVTVPTASIADERLRFRPALPDKVAAAGGLPLGVADKLFLALAEPEAFPPETRAFGRTDRAATGAYHFRPFGRPLVEAYFGGRLAAELEAAGDGAFADFAMAELAALFGSGITQRLRPLAGSAWRIDPLAGGSYSHALPGRADERARLAAPVDGRLFFAGEACSPHDFSTAHGAWLSGIAAAEQAMAAWAGSQPS